MIDMSIDDTHDKSPGGLVRYCDHCGEPRDNWRTDRYAEHLAQCSVIDSERTSIREFLGDDE
jgi:hypothetical protein